MLNTMPTADPSAKYDGDDPMSKLYRLLKELELGAGVDWRKVAQETPRSQFMTIIEMYFAAPFTLNAIVGLDETRHMVVIIAYVEETATREITRGTDGGTCTTYNLTMPQLDVVWTVFREPWASVRGTEPE